MGLGPSWIPLTFENYLDHCLDIKQKGQKCPKRQVTQAAIRLVTAIIKFRNNERNFRSPS